MSDTLLSQMPEDELRREIEERVLKHVFPPVLELCSRIQSEWQEFLVEHPELRTARMEMVASLYGFRLKDAGIDAIVNSIMATIEQPPDLV